MQYLDLETFETINRDPFTEWLLIALMLEDDVFGYEVLLYLQDSSVDYSLIQSGYQEHHHLH